MVRITPVFFSHEVRPFGWNIHRDLSKFPTGQAALGCGGDAWPFFGLRRPHVLTDFFLQGKRKVRKCQVDLANLYDLYP